MSTRNPHELWKNWKIIPKEPNALLGELDSICSVLLFEEFPKKVSKFLVIFPNF
jgi:hypothetical protein